MLLKLLILYASDDDAGRSALVAAVPVRGNSEAVVMSQAGNILQTVTADVRMQGLFTIKERSQQMLQMFQSRRLQAHSDVAMFLWKMSETAIAITCEAATVKRAAFIATTCFKGQTKNC